MSVSDDENGVAHHQVPWAPRHPICDHHHEQSPRLRHKRDWQRDYPTCLWCVTQKANEK